MKQPRSPLHFTEAEQIADALAQRWPGITGQDTAPAQEQLADLVQWIMRKAAEAIDERDGEGISNG